MYIKKKTSIGHDVSKGYHLVKFRLFSEIQTHFMIDAMSKVIVLSRNCNLVGVFVCYDETICLLAGLLACLILCFLDSSLAFLIPCLLASFSTSFPGRLINYTLIGMDFNC